MSERLKAAQTALQSGNREEAIKQLQAEITEKPNSPAVVYRELAAQFYHLQQYEEGLHWAERGVKLHPRDEHSLNINGVILRRLRRYPEAVELFNRALKVNPRSDAAQSNKANALIDMGDGSRAEQVLLILVRKDPRNAELQRQLGRALRLQGKLEAATVRFRQATTLQPSLVDAWLDLTAALQDLHRQEEAQKEIDKGLAAIPDDDRLYESKVTAMRRGGQRRVVETYLESLRPKMENKAWLHNQLGSVISDYDRERGNIHMRRAVEMDGGNVDYRMALIESLERTRSGDEGANIDEAYELLKSCDLEAASGAHKKVATEVLIRVGDFAAADALGDVGELSRLWSAGRLHTALLKLLSRVTNDRDRRAVLKSHSTWGEAVEAYAKTDPIETSAPRPKDGRIRLGFMSSDLRRHPVAYFASPLFDHIPPDFDVYCYSFYQGEEDDLQKRITSQVKAYRWEKDITAKAAAQMIADDQLDILIELGGSTHMNKLEVMAFKPAPIQASWLGYPHSAGLKSIDHLITDPYLTPEDESLMIETPLIMPASWIAMSPLAFPEFAIEPSPPFTRHGHVTFGTANNSYKYNTAMLKVWAQIVVGTPDSKFIFVRPEGGSAAFRRNITAIFADEGVSADRIIFEATRGRHMPHYNRIDIALDTFPQTGGTTTCEALWMGVPTVSLVGPTIYERLSYSILNNAGLGDLCVRTVDEYVEKAMSLAADTERLADLRLNLRNRLRISPLGQTETFAGDFYAMIAKAVGESPSAIPH